MKKYKIQLNARAYRDLEEIFEYIANDLQSPEYAKGQTDRLWKSLKTLEIFPSSHQERLVGNYAGKGYRQLLIDNYLAIFKSWIGTYDVFKLEGEYGIHDPALLNNNIWCI